MKSQSLAYKYAITSVLLWSTVASAFKIALKYLTPLELVLYSSFSSFVILFVVVLFQKKIQDVFFHIKHNFKTVFLLGLINPFLYYLILFKAYDLLPAQEAQAINYTWALMLSFLSVIFLKQKLALKDIVAGILCYFGVLVIASKGDILDLNFSSYEGVFLAVLSTIFWSFYWIINTKIKVDAIVGLFSNFIISLPLIFLYFILTQDFKIHSSNAILSSLYVGCFEMGITFLFWLKAMQSAQNTSKIANLIFISPFLSLVLIYFLLGEKIYISTIIGLSFIISGLIFQSLKKI